MVKENYRCKENYWGLVVRQSGARPVIFCVSKKLSEKLRTMNRALDSLVQESVSGGKTLDPNISMVLLGDSTVMGGYRQGALLYLRKMAPLKCLVRLICTSKHVILEVKEKGAIGRYALCRSMLVSYGRLQAPSASKN